MMAGGPQDAASIVTRHLILFEDETEIFWIYRSFDITLQSQTVMQKPGHGHAGGSAGRPEACRNNMNSVYSTLFLDRLKSGKSQSQSGMRRQ